MPRSAILKGLLFFFALAISLSCEDFDDGMGNDFDDGSLDNRKGATLDIYEAEDRTSASGCNVRTNHAGFTGSGFMDYGGNGTWIEWNTVETITAGEYNVSFRYANGSSGNRQGAAIINGKNVSNVTFTRTGAWTTWKTDSIKAQLRQGKNTIRVMANTGSGGPNLDKMEVSISDLCPNDPVKFEPGECGCGVPEGTCGNDKNVARGKSTRQSSTAYNGASSRAVDGNTSGDWSQGSITHTARTSAPWWMVDLGASHQLSGVTLWNRTNCCSERLSNFHVDYLDQAGRVIAKKDYPGQVGIRADINLAASGVYSVRVQLNGTNYLSLAEVEVWGTTGGGGTSRCAEASEHKSATLSCSSGEKINSIAFASYGLPTGACDTDFAVGSCHATSSKSKVEAACLNKQSCSVTASNSVFGDPCPGKGKKIAITYTCSGGAIDNCPNDPNKTEPGECGCGVPEGTCDECTDTMRAGDKILPGQHICSQNGTYEFGLTSAGKLAIWSGADTLWSGGTFGSSVHLIMQGDGNLVVYNPTKALWASNTHGNTGSTLKLENDGRVVIRLGNTILWQKGGTGPVDNCPNDPKKTEPGECGCGVPEGSCGGGGKVQSKQGYFSWGGIRVDYKSAGGMTKGGLKSTPAKSGDYEIVSFGASHGGGTGKVNQYFDEARMLGQKFQKIGVRGEEDKKIEMWIRKNTGQSQINIPSDARAYNFLAVDGNGIQLALNSIRSATVQSAGQPYKVPNSGGYGLKVLSYFSDDSVELTQIGSGTLLFQDWGFGDGDGLSIVLYAPGREPPSTIAVNRHDSGGFQYVGMMATFSQ